MLDVIFRICKYGSQKKVIYESRHQQRRLDRDSVTNKLLPTPLVLFIIPPPHTHKLSGRRFWLSLLTSGFEGSCFGISFFCCVSKEPPNVRISLLACEAFRGEKIVLELLEHNIGHFSKRP